ncbi:MAG: TldD/PmbA family protein [Ignavibacteriae bacterium]|nr:TldD/PmbA family protein [Ignavibacteriota bacterium]
MIIEQDEAAGIIEKILSYSSADSASVNFSGSNSNNLRFALNSVSTCGAVDSVSVSITSNFGKKSGSVNITSIDDESLKNGVLQSEKIAKLSPDNAEFMPPPEKQTGYYEVKEYFEDTNSVTPENLAEKISYTLDKAVQNDLVSSGFSKVETKFNSIGNSNKLLAYSKSTNSSFSSTMRSKSGNGSSKVNRAYANIDLLNVRKFSDKVIDNALLSKNPQSYEPGKYVTILDNSAASDMLNNMLWTLNLRSADEGRSFFSNNSKGNKIGQKLVSDKVHIYSDPQNDLAPASPFNSEGYPIRKTDWFSEGVLKNLYSTIYWAKKTGTEYISYPSNIIMDGSDKTVEQLISETEKGIFVTRLWYIRSVDQKQMLLTGLTRDGVFLIENGKIKNSINNFRFNESPINVLKNVIDMSAAEKVVGSETGDSKIVVPALKLSEFNFSTISDAF